MQATPTEFPDVLLIEPRLFKDDRGMFYESYNQRKFSSFGLNYQFVQDNQSYSHQHVLRGMHYQLQQPQAKLVRVMAGKIYDVVVDIRRYSKNFGKWVGFELSSDNKVALMIPPWYAHGFLVLSEFAEVQYKASDFYAPEYERCIRWDDPDIKIKWPITASPILSAKDRQGVFLKDAVVFE